jgi:GT2 family glycosyltransferase
MCQNTTHTNPLVSIVIVSWNRKFEVEHTLSEYKKQTYNNFEIIVVDNNSTDGTKELIKAEFPDVRLFELSENTGYHAFNIGMQNAKGEIIIISDDDAYLEHDGINKIIDKFNLNPNLCIAISKIVYFPLEIEWQWYQKEIKDTTKSYDAHYFNSVGVGLRKNMIEKIGYFDADYFFWGCELDLATRAIAAGYDVKFFPDITVYHKYHAHKEKNKLGIFLYYAPRNVIFYYWKHYPFHIAFGRSIIRIPFDFFWTIFRSKFTISPFKALKAIIVGFNKNLKKRNVIPKQYVRKALGYQSEINNLYTFLKITINNQIKKRKLIKRKNVKSVSKD